MHSLCHICLVIMPLFKLPTSGGPYLLPISQVPDETPLFRLSAIVVIRIQTHGGIP